MSNKPAVSIIVPIYNAQLYLEAALESLRAQTLSDIEIICVNDGSTDDSLEIMQKFAAQDKRFIIIDKENGGYGCAMNTGIAAAHGQYIGILEPDDFVPKNMFACLYEDAQLNADGSLVHPHINGEHHTSANHTSSDNCPNQESARWADIVKSSFYQLYDGDKNHPTHIIERDLLGIGLPKEKRVVKAKDIPTVFMNHPSIWSCIYKKSFLEEHNIKFIEAPGAGWVDNPFLFATLCQAQTIVWDPRPFYFYRRTNENASSYLKNWQIPLDRTDEILDLRDNIPISDKYIRMIIAKRTFYYYQSILNGMEFDAFDAELYKRMKAEILRFKKHDVTRNPHLNHDHVRFYLEMTGRQNEKLKARAACAQPTLSIVAHGHNRCAYVYECLEGWLKSSPQEIQVLWHDEHPSTDGTKMFLEEIAARDARVSYHDKSAYSLPQDVSAEWIYFIAHDTHAASKKSLQHITDTLSKTQADLVCFGANMSADKRSGLMSSDDALHILFDCACGRMSDVAVRRSLLKEALCELESYFDKAEGSAATKSVAKDDDATTEAATAGIVAAQLSKDKLSKDDLFKDGGRLLFTCLALNAKSIEFVCKSEAVHLRRSPKVPSVMIPPADVELKNTLLPTLQNIQGIIKAHDKTDLMEETFSYYVASCMVADLDKQETHEQFNQMTDLLKSGYTKELLGDISRFFPLQKGSNLELIYLLEKGEQDYLFARPEASYLEKLVGRKTLVQRVRALLVKFSWLPGPTYWFHRLSRKVNGL